MPKPFPGGNDAGEPSRLGKCQTGAHLTNSEEDFFASSPTANLVGDNEEGHVISLRLRSPGLRSLLVF
jgi:hypothetical protein